MLWLVVCLALGKSWLVTSMRIPPNCSMQAQKISAEFGGKYDRHQLRDRWHGQSSQRMSRNMGRWAADEDERLRRVSHTGFSCFFVTRLVRRILESVLRTNPTVDLCSSLGPLPTLNPCAGGGQAGSAVARGVRTGGHTYTPAVQGAL